MKTYSEEIEESRQSAFDAALEEKDVAEAQQEDTPREYVLGEDNYDVDVQIGEPEPEPEPVAEDTTSVLNKLVDVLTANQPKPVEEKAKERPGIPTANISEIQKEFNDKLHETEDPFTLAMSATEKVFGSQLAAQARVIQELKRDALKADPDKAFIMDNYKKDIEDIVAGLPAEQQNHPDVYVYAVNKVSTDHISELVEHKMKAELESRTTRTAPGSNNVLGATGPATPAKKRKKVYATKHDEAMARKHGLKLKDYLVSRGKI